METTPNNTGLHCPHCDAALPVNAKSCWLCLSPLNATDFMAGAARPPAPPSETPPNYSMSSLMMFVTLLCVVLGVLTIARGLGVIVAFIAFIAWLRTAVNVQRRSANNEILTTGDKVLMFFRSAVSTFLIVGAVLVACVVMLFIACLAMIGNASHM